MEAAAPARFLRAHAMRPTGWGLIGEDTRSAPSPLHTSARLARGGNPPLHRMFLGVTFHAVTGKLMGSIRGSSNVATYVTGTKTINDGQYVAYVRDTSAQLLRLFVDGEADGTVALTANNIANTDTFSGCLGRSCLTGFWK